MRRWGRSLLGALLFLAAVRPAAAIVHLPPPEDRSVHDFAGVLSPEAVSRMEARHKELFDKTGVALVVVTVKNLDGEPIDDFAVRTAKEWGVGKKGQDRGIVVALSTGDRRVYIATGYGVEGYLPDGKIGGILDEYVIPQLRQNDWSGGIERASEALTAASAAEYHVTITGVEAREAPDAGTRGRPPKGLGILPIIILAIFIIILIKNPSLIWLLLASGMGRGGRGGWRGGGFGGGGFGGGQGGGFGGFGSGGFEKRGAGRGF
jgi:uncharacterized protein